MSTTVTSSDRSQQAKKTLSFLRSRGSLLWPLGHQEPAPCYSAPKAPWLTSSCRYSLMTVMQEYVVRFCCVLLHCIVVTMAYLKFCVHREWLSVWTPCGNPSWRLTVSNEPPSSSTAPLFASLRPVFQLDQILLHHPPLTTCLTFTPPQHQPLRLDHLFGLVYNWQPWNTELSKYPHLRI